MFHVISLNSNCNVYPKFTSLSPYFYQTSSIEVEAVLEILNVGVDMVHIYKVNSTNYNFAFQLTNNNSGDNLLPELEQIDISDKQSNLQYLFKNKLVINDKFVIPF